MRRPTLFIILVIAFLTTLFVLDLYISEQFFCASCDYDDQHFFYTLFYYNNSGTGYHSEFTILNFAIVTIASILLSLAVVKRRGHGGNLS